MNNLKLLSLIIFSFPYFSYSAELTTELIPVHQLARQFVKDIERIEVFYPKQFERLEMDWNKTSLEYIKEFEKENDIEKKMNIFSRLYNSWNNAHHRPISIKGIITPASDENLELPVRIFGQGIKLSQARFFISEISTKNTPLNINSGDELISYNNISISNYVLKARDELGNESPEAHINQMARNLFLQVRCSWGKINCWKRGDNVQLTLKTCTLAN